MNEKNEIAIVPVTFGELREMAETMAVSGMFGKNPAQMMSLMLIAQAEGLHPAIAAMEYDVIQNRPALKGQAALARFQQAGGVVNWITRTDQEAKAEFVPPKGNPLTVSWTMDKARKMGLDQKDNWKKQPGVMLTWRCVAEGIRAVYPACLNRMYLAEEAQDFEPVRDVTPKAEPKKAIKPAPKTEAPKPESNAIDWNARASELTLKHGIDRTMKAAIWNESKKDAKTYCEKIEAIMKAEKEAPAHESEQAPESGLFDSPPDVTEIVTELEAWATADNLSQALRDEITKAIGDVFTPYENYRALMDKILAEVG